MTALITDSFRVQTAIDFKETFNNRHYYTALSQFSEWNSEISPDIATSAFTDSFFKIWSELIGLKKINKDNVFNVIKRYDWVQGDEDYFAYNPGDNLLFSKKFYTVVETGAGANIYKCIERGSGGTVTKPTFTSKNSVKFGDGYRWKYMYSITTEELSLFDLENYIPVFNVEDNEDDSDYGLEPTPRGGHGTNNLIELGAYKIAITIDIEYNEGKVFPINTSFRKVGIISGIENTSGGQITKELPRVNVSFELKDFSGLGLVTGNIIRSGTKRGRIVGFELLPSGNYWVHIQEVIGTFTSGDVVDSNFGIGISSGTITGTVNKPEITPYTGDVIYVDNILAISRNGNQVDRITMVIEF